MPKKSHITSVIVYPSTVAPILYGPTAGDQAIRDGTTPHAVTVPGGVHTTLGPGHLTQSNIDFAGEGATIWVTKGTHSVTSALTPRRNQTYYFESAAGRTRTSADSAVIDGGSTSSTALFSSSEGGISIYGGLWQNQGNASSSSANAVIHSGGAAAEGNWLVQDAIIDTNYRIGLSFQGPDCVGLRCILSNNGQYGYTVTATADRAALRYSEVSGNNTLLANPGGDASAMKISGGPEACETSYCWFHDNLGFGIWYDLANTLASEGHRVFENVCETNSRSGLFMEGVGDNVKIYRNSVLENGSSTTIGGQVASFENCVGARITDSDATRGAGVTSEVYLNKFDFTGTQSGSVGGLLLLWNHDGHPYRMDNWTVHNNQFWLRGTNSSRVRGEDTATHDPPVGSESNKSMWTSSINFTDNDYRVASLSTNYWYWQTNVAYSWASWVAHFTADGPRSGL